MITLDSLPCIYPYTHFNNCKLCYKFTFFVCSFTISLGIPVSVWNPSFLFPLRVKLLHHVKWYAIQFFLHILCIISSAHLHHTLLSWKICIRVLIGIFNINRKLWKRIILCYTWNMKPGGPLGSRPLPSRLKLEN